MKLISFQTKKVEYANEKYKNEWPNNKFLVTNNLPKYYKNQNDTTSFVNLLLEPIFTEIVLLKLHWWYELFFNILSWNVKCILRMVIHSSYPQNMARYDYILNTKFCFQSLKL